MRGLKSKAGEKHGQGAFEYLLLVAAAVLFITALTFIVKQVIR